MEKRDIYKCVKKKDLSEYMKTSKKMSMHSVRYSPPIEGKNSASASYGIFYATHNLEPCIAKGYQKAKFKQYEDLNNFLVAIYKTKISHITGANQLYFLLPYYDYGNLQDYLDMNVYFTESQVADFILQIAEQLITLHECRLYHGELSPQHICLTLDGTRIKYKICGFGRFIPNKPKEHFADPLLKPYLDLRIIENPYEEYDSSCDIWSLGIMAYRLVTGEFPNLESKSMAGTNYEYLNPVSKIQLSTKFNYFISRCLLNNPKARLKANKISIQPFLIPELDNIKDYEITDECLGKGGYGSVFKAYRKGDHSRVFAMKILRASKKLEDINSNAEYNHEILLLGEMTIYQTVKNSPYIVNLYDYFVYKGQIHLVLEYFNGGDLENYILEQQKILGGSPESSPVEKAKWKVMAKNLELEMKINLKEFAYNLAHAILDLHKKQIVHRDIKPKNILVMVDENTKQFCTSRLSDFGACYEKLIAEDEMRTVIGVKGYMAPEIIKGSYDLSVDVWSYGITLYVVAFGILPIKENPSLWTDKDLKLKYPDKSLFVVSERYKDLIEKCIVFDPKKRLTMEEVLNHEFFREERLIRIPIIPKIYEVDYGHILVKGSSFNVYNVTYTPADAKLLLKVVKPTSEKEKNEIIRDVQDLLLFRGCKTIYRLCQCFVVEDKFNLVLEYTERETLEDYVNSLKGKQMDTDTLYRFAYSIAKSIYDIHEYDFKVVGEIEPYTFYLCSDKTSVGIIKNIKYAGYSHLIQDVTGKEATKSYNKSSEYISKFGEILYYMMFGTVDGYEACLEADKSSSLTSKQMKNAFELVKKCFSAKYYKVEQLLDDEYFHDY